MDFSITNFGQRVRKLRRERDWTQQDLQQRAGIHYTTISRLEKGHADQLYLETVLKLAAAFCVRVDDLVYGDQSQ